MSAAVDPEVAALVREVLAEEVARLRAKRGMPGASSPGVREEWVRIRSDADLQGFATRVLAMAGDREAKRALAAGRIAFRLDRGDPERQDRAPPPVAHAPASARTEVIERGLFGERQAQRLPPETTRVRLGRQVKLTPLARDRLRRRGITIERM